MSLSSRILRRSVLGLSCLFPAVCAAQPGVPQFVQPIVEYTYGRVTSFVPGSLQGGLPTQDILYINAATVSGSTSSVLVGELLSTNQGQGLQNLNENQITFPNVSNVVAALADFNRDGKTDYAFALTRPSGSNGPNLCVYYGTGNGLFGDAYDGPGSSFTGQYPPSGGKSGCITFPEPGATAPPNYTFITAPHLDTSDGPQLIIEDSANNLVTILANGGTVANNGVLTAFTVWNYIHLSAADGPGPIYAADLNGDGNTDLVINCQNSQSALVYFGNGDNTFRPPVRYTFGGHVHSMLLEDMDGDGHPDMVVEADNGVIEIFHGNPDGTFATTSEGGTSALVDGYSGNGGHLAAIYAEAANPAKLDILTTTPIGLSVLQPQAVGSLAYALQGIYNIGPGRSSYALGQFRSNGGVPVLAVDSPEGVAIVLGDTNGDGGFQTSKAYSALAPALGATIGKFRNAANNPNGYLDVVAATGATQAQLLTNNGSGTFNTSPGVVDPGPTPANVPATVWSNILSGDFNGDGKLDILYSLTGLPQPPPSEPFPILYFQYGNGDGTFNPSGSPFSIAAPAANLDGFYPETAVGDFNGDGIAGVALSTATLDIEMMGVPGLLIARS